MDQEQRITNLENAMHQMVAHYWRFQGRINTLEAIATQAVLDRANLDDNPFQWVQAYVQNVGALPKSLIADLDDQSKAEQFKQEVTIAIEEFLEQLLVKASGLKGAPSKK